MLLPKDHEKITFLVLEAITLLCKDVLTYQEEVKIEGLLGITLDSKEVILVSMNKQISHDITSARGNGAEISKRPKGWKQRTGPNLHKHQDKLINHDIIRPKKN